MIKCQILLVIILSVSLLVIATGVASAQPLESIQSPKQQLDRGITPYDVICRNGLILVERSSDKIACVYETTAQKMGWNVISLPASILDKTPNNQLNMDNSNKIIHETYGTLITTAAKLNASLSATIPNSVSINETFDIQYVWTEDPVYGYFSNTVENDYNILSMATSEVEFVNAKNNWDFDNCVKGALDKINQTSKNASDRTGTFSYKFVKSPGVVFTYPSIIIFGTDSSHVSIYAIDDGNGTIILEKMNNHGKIPYDPPCAQDEMIQSIVAAFENNAHNLTVP